MDTANVKYLKDYRPPAFTVDTVDLTVELKDQDTLVDARLAVRRNPEAEGNGRPFALDGRELDLTYVAIDGRELSRDAYALDEEQLTLSGVPDEFILETRVRIQPQENAALEGLYKSGDMFCTQCESEGFRRITFFPDRPDVMARYTCTIVGDKKRHPLLLANGNRVAAGEMEEGRHWVRWEDPFPKPSYLFAMVAGDLFCLSDTFRTMSGREVKLEIYTEHENADKCDHAMEALKKSMRWDEETFGLEYDLDVYMIVAVNDFNMGAMENKGLNVFNAKYVLARPDTATDQDFWNIDRVVAHEYFHNWTGNRVTLRNWFQLSLKEGLTVYRDQEFSSDLTSRPVKRIGDVRTLRAYQFPEDAGPMAHPVRPASYIKMDNFYTVTVYEKGSEVVRMIRTLVGREGFRKGMDLYFQRHDGKAVTVEDFVEAMADANGADFDHFMLWYSQAGTPEIRVRGEYDDRKREYALTLSQHVPPTPDMSEKSPMHIPVAVGLLDAEGRDVPLRLTDEAEATGTTRVLDLKKSEQTFVFGDVPSGVVPSVLRNFSAPVKRVDEVDDETLAFLFARDTDPFNRWDAGQKLFARTLLRLVEDHRSGKELTLDESVVEPFRRTLRHPELDKAFIAEALTLPTEAELAILMSERGDIDPDAIHGARWFATARLAERLQSDFEEIYQANQETGEYVVDPPSVGRRRMKNLALGFLGRIEGQESVRRAWEQFDGATNMTDSMAALSVLSHIDCPERERALEQFFERWKADTLVLDKWFTLQATAQLPDTLDRVRELLDHPAFSIKNPNKVRALVGAFCGGNPWRFHQSSGAGYVFAADRVLEIDDFNPQIAARMVAVFNHWRKYEPARREQMREQLERIIHHDGLSKHVYEIVSKALG
ncbi:MAG: aminopeptidase N [Desulfococcaceae bacterium]